MEQPKQNRKTTLVLNYDKRRFDGGSELDLIRHIERRKTVAQLERLEQQQYAIDQAKAILKANGHSAQEAASDSQTASQTGSETHSQTLPMTAPSLLPEGIAATGASPAPAMSKVRQTLVRGPLEICVGAVGILTAALAIMTFSRKGHHNQALLAQSRGVLKDCLQTLAQGILHMAQSPFLALQLVLKLA